MKPGEHILLQAPPSSRNILKLPNSSLNAPKRMNFIHSLNFKVYFWIGKCDILKVQKYKKAVWFVANDI